MALALGMAAGWGCAGSSEDQQPYLEEVVVREIEVEGLSIRMEGRGLDEEVVEWSLEKGEAEARRLSELLMADRPGSEIDVLNQVPMRIEIALAPDTMQALHNALEVAEVTGGAYDPTAVSPLRRLWHFDRDTPRVPRDFEIESTLRNVDWTDVEISESGTSASRYARRTVIDLGPVAVGAVLDGTAAEMARTGAIGGFVSSSGIFVAFGQIDPPWRLNTGADGRGPGITLFAGAAAVARPGPPRRTEDGRTLREPFDPRSGRPLEGAEGAVWAMARAGTGARAGGAAAAILVMGEEAPKWLDRTPEVVGAIWMADGRRFTSPGVRVRWDGH